MRKLLLSLVLSSAALTTAAHADTFNFNFNFYGTTQSGSVTTGTITTDSSGGAVGGYLEVGNQWGSSDGLPFSSSKPYADYSRVFLDGEGTSLTLFVPSNLAAGSTAFVCSTTTVCPAYDGSVNSYVEREGASDIDRFVSGTLTSQNPSAVTTAATPEPSSLVLLGTGALGMAGAVRRRFLARA